jgi:hypothetical protein
VLQVQKISRLALRSLRDPIYIEFWS